MIVRSTDGSNDWNFGKGINDYKQGVDAIAQNLAMLLLCVLGDCFFDLAAGLDWWNLLGSKQPTLLSAAIQACILNAEGISGINSLTMNLDANRHVTLFYDVSTFLGGRIRDTIGYILTEDNLILDTEGGDEIHG